MNKRQRKKKSYYEITCLSEWGWIMSYKELKRVKRDFHENIYVINNFRTIDNTEECEELSRILGIPFVDTKKVYHYPNRLRIRTLRKWEGIKPMIF